MSDAALPPPIPPTHPLDLDLTEVPAWPKVVGILSIVWGSLGLLCGVCGGVMQAFQESLTKMGDPDMPPLPQAMKSSMLELIGSGLGVALSLFLLIAGIVLVRRRAAARPMHITYALVEFLLLALMVVAQFSKIEALRQLAQQDPKNKWLMMSGGTSGPIISIAVILVIGLPYPIFCLIWFGMVKRTHESMLVRKIADAS